MSFNLTVKKTDGTSFPIDLAAGQSIFVLGANGTGKSSLLHKFSQSAGRQARRISASRQTWFPAAGIEFAPAQKESLEQQSYQWTTNENARWMEQNAQVRSGLTLYDLINAENVNEKKIADAVRRGDFEDAKKLALEVAPIAKINELLAFSNLNIKISVEEGYKLMASKGGSALYGAERLSDGERNAMLIAADVLTAKPGTLLIIDEPERHLHRSIISPLLSQLFRHRSDCAFVVGTHDLMLPVDNSESRILLVRECTYTNSTANNWDVDIIPANTEIEDSLKEDIVGARRRIVFVEGKESSLDHPLYSILFPGISIRPKGSSRDVEFAVTGITSSNDLHWVKAWGVIDNDGRDAASIANLLTKRIHALPFYSVESIYYHPKLIKAVAHSQAAVTGGDGEAIGDQAIKAGIDAVLPDLERLAAKAVEKSIRRMYFSNLPTLQSIEQKQPISLNIDTAAIVAQEAADLTSAAEAGDWIKILTRCPIRETRARDSIARTIGLQTKHQYESAVLQLLRNDLEILKIARNFFGSLAAELIAP